MKTYSVESWVDRRKNREFSSFQEAKEYVWFLAKEQSSLEKIDPSRLEFYDCTHFDGYMGVSPEGHDENGAHQYWPTIEEKE